MTEGKRVWLGFRKKEAGKAKPLGKLTPNSAWAHLQPCYQHNTVIVSHISFVYKKMMFQKKDNLQNPCSKSFQMPKP